mgnify:CR=1 FL=1
MATNQTISTLTDPKGIDKVVTDLNTQLLTLSWLDNAYGVAEKHYEDGNTFPVIHASGIDYEVLRPDSYKDNFCFWVLDDPQMVDDMPGRTTSRAKVRLVVWFDYSKVFPSVNGYTAENVIALLLEKIRSTSSGSVKITRTYRDPQNVYRGFKFPMNDKPFMRPFGCVGIELEAVNYEVC